MKNKWKLAFWTLVVFLGLGIGALYLRVTAPTAVSPETPAYQASDTSVEVTMNRKQVNALSANYLQRFLRDSKIKYRFVVGEKYATVIGTTKVLGSRVQFAMKFIPEKTANGNIRLKAKGLSVGRLNLPVRIVLAYVKKNYDLPRWVAINQRRQTILLDLNKYSQKQSVRYSAKQLDMAKGQFTFLITIPQEAK